MNPKNYIQDIAGNEAHREGPIAKAIENQTAKLPSDTFLWLAVGSIAASATLQILGKKETSTFIGQWAPTFLILGLYNKIVKSVGSDKESSDREDRSFSRESFDSEESSEQELDSDTEEESEAPRAKRTIAKPVKAANSVNASNYSKGEGEPEGLQQSAAL